MKKPARNPSRGSLRWFREFWIEIFSDDSPAGEVNLAHAVAQLSYENKKLRERLTELEELIGDMAAKTGQDFETIFGLQERTEKMTKAGFEALGVGLRMVDPEDPEFKPCNNPDCEGCRKVLQTIRSKALTGKDGMTLINGTPHLHECAIVKEGISVTCTCGSEGERERQERLRTSN